VTAAANGSYSVDVINGQQGKYANVTLSTSGSNASVQLTQFSGELGTDDTHFILNFTTSTTPPTNVSAPMGDQQALVYVTADSKYMQNGTIANATYVFSVDDARLTQEGVSPDSLTAYALVNGTWQQVNATVRPTESGGHALVASTSGYRSLAVLGSQSNATTTTATGTTTAGNSSNGGSDTTTTTSGSSSSGGGATTTGTSTGSNQPGFGVGVALVALLALALLARRRD